MHIKAKWVLMTMSPASLRTSRWKPSPKTCWRKSSAFNSVHSAGKSLRHESEPGDIGAVGEENRRHEDDWTAAQRATEPRHQGSSVRPSTPTALTARAPFLRTRCARRARRRGLAGY